MRNVDVLEGTPTILNLTQSTRFVQHTRKVWAADVEEAVELGATGVVVHVNIGSRWTPEMLERLAKVAKQARANEMPLMALMYPRGERADGSDENFLDERDNDRDAYTKRVRHCVRIAVELGADIVRTHYTGTIETFATVVDSAQGVPILVSGGDPTDTHSFLKLVSDACAAGGSGVAAGRNIFNADDPTSVITALRAVVHHNVAPEVALSTQ